MAIGIDAGDPNLLIQWATAGHLPHLQAFLGKGVTGPLRSPPGMADDGVWPSFSTGVWPADHGRFHHLARLPGHYDAIRFQDHHFGHRPFWEFLDRQGVRVAVLDVPKSPRAELIHGVEVNNFRVHGVDGSLSSRPPEFALELATRYPADQTDRPDSDHFICESGPLASAERSEFVDLTRRSVLDKTSVAVDLLESGCDFFLAVFKEAHCAGHKLWPPGPDMLAVYKELDAALGRLLRYSSDNTTTIIFSALGMSANYHGNGALDQILRRLERRLLPAWLNLRIEGDKLAHRVRRRMGLTSASQGLAHRLAFVVPHNELSGAIRVNLRGREPDGCVGAGAEHHHLCDLIEAEMMSLRNVETGQPVVRNVVRLDQVQTGTRQSYLPDMLVVWQRDAPIRSIASPAVGVVCNRTAQESPGKNVEGGFYAARGPDRPGAERFHGTSADHAIVDLAPTIVQLFGLQLPNTKGRPIPSILAPVRQATGSDGLRSIPFH